MRAAGLMIRAGNPEKLRCVVFRNFRKRAETYRRGKGGIMFRPVFRRSCMGGRKKRTACGSDLTEASFFGVKDDAPEAARKPDFPEKRQKNSPFGS